jgi:hypothetical protein
MVFYFLCRQPQEHILFDSKVLNFEKTGNRVHSAARGQRCSSRPSKCQTSMALSVFPRPLSQCSPPNDRTFDKPITEHLSRWTLRHSFDKGSIIAQRPSSNFNRLWLRRRIFRAWSWNAAAYHCLRATFASACARWKAAAPPPLRDALACSRPTISALIIQPSLHVAQWWRILLIIYQSTVGKVLEL